MFIEKADALMGVCERAFQALANTCLLIMLIANMAQITSRAILDQGISMVFPWTVFLFTWSVFFGFFVLYRQGGDITVDFFVDRFGATGRKVARHFVNFITVTLMGIMLWHAPQTLLQQVGDEMEIISLDRWILTFPLFLSCALVMLNSFLDTAKAMRGDPEPVFFRGIDDEDESA